MPVNVPQSCSIDLLLNKLESPFSNYTACVWNWPYGCGNEKEYVKIWKRQRQEQQEQQEQQQQQQQDRFRSEKSLFDPFHFIWQNTL